MAENLRKSFERCCRLCAEEQDVTIMLFGEEAEALLLQTKLKDYLLIGVEEEDKLPKNICIRCCSKLQTVCDFIDTARRAQNLLLNRRNELDQISEQHVSSTMSNKSESLSDEETRSSKMEVSVDPMMVLQNSEEEVCIAEKCQSKSEEVTSLNSADGEYVTIKLIKRGEALEETPSPPNESPLNETPLNETPSNETNTEPNKLFKPFPCTVCKRSFLTDLALKNHSWSHLKDDSKSDGTRYECSQCDQAFELKNDLFIHLKEHRNNALCQLCGRSFRSEANLEAHMLLHFSMRKAFTCKICGRSYNTRSNLAVHSVTHSDNRPFGCHLCKKSFKRSQELKFHVNQHTGAKPYKCPFCDKRFASSGNCYSHRNRMHPGMSVRNNKKICRVIATVSNAAVDPAENKVPDQSIPPNELKTTLNKGIYRYKCHLCDHSFMRKDNFTYHMFQHTGIKPFHCSLCSEKFISRKGLLGHHDKVHQKNQRPPALLSKNKYLR